MYFIFKQDSVAAERIVVDIKKTLDKNNIPYQEISTISKQTPIISIGDDRHFLRTFIQTKENNVFCVGTGGTVLSDVTPLNYDKYLKKIIDGKWFIQKKTRLYVEKQGSESGLNDILIFPQKSANLIKYSLILDGNELWTDIADGVIFSTPTGSTAYNLSAGGSAVIGDPEIICITPVNSTNKQHPIIVSDKSSISIRLLSKSSIAIYDGIKRMPILKDEITISKSRHYANIIRCKQDISIFNQIKRKDVPYTQKPFIDLSPSQKFIIKMLSIKGAMTQKEIFISTGLPSRTIRESLNILEKKQLIEKNPFPHDVRQNVYRIFNRH